MNTIKKMSYASIGVLTAASYGITNAAATESSGFGNLAAAETIRSRSGLAKDGIDSSIANIISRLLMFLGIIGVIYAIWGGFLILTAAGDDDKVKKGRQVIVHAILGIIVIFLSYSIINWVLKSITNVDDVTGA